MAKAPEFQAWTDEFVNAQRGYWDLWTKLAQEGLKTDPKASQQALGPWSDAFTGWWKGLDTALPQQAENAAALGAMFEQGRMFMQMAETSARYFGAYAKEADGAMDWQHQLGTALEQFKSCLSIGDSQAWSNASKNWLQYGQSPLDTWMQSMNGLMKNSSEMLESFGAEVSPLGGGIEQTTRKLLGMPAIGYSRESQEHLQKAIHLQMEHQQAAQKLTMAMSKVTAEAMDLMFKKLVDMGQRGESIKSLRALYDLWVDCSEESFGRFALTENFSRLYADFVNTLMAFRRQLQVMLDDALAKLNLPNRRELSTQGERVHELRKQVARLDERVHALQGGADTSALRAEVEASAKRIHNLETEILALRRLVEERLVAPPVPVVAATAASLAPAHAPIDATTVEEPEEARPGNNRGGRPGKRR